MRVATFNCNSIRTRLGTVTAWLREHRPDVLALQETKVEDHLFPLGELAAEGYHVAFRGMKAYNGVAILSRSKPEEVLFGLAGEPKDEPRLVQATIDGVTFLNTYVPQGRDIEHEMFRYKLSWYERLRSMIAGRFKASDRVIWLGDMNVAVEPIDVHNPDQRQDHVCYHREVREAFKATCAWGFTDVFRSFHPEPGQYTFFDYRTSFRGVTGEGWRIDYILASAAQAKRAQGSWIDMKPRLEPRPSDHTFLVADFS